MSEIPKHVAFIRKYKPFIVLALVFSGFAICYSSPWLTEDSTEYLLTSKTDAYYNEQADIYIFDHNATQFSQYWSYDEAPFGRKVQLRFEATFENGTKYSWANYYFVDPIGGLNYLGNKTVNV